MSGTAAKPKMGMSKRRLVIVSFALGLLLTGLSALVRIDTGTGPRCAYPTGNGPLDELALKYYPQKQLGLPLPYYVLQEPAPGCMDVSDRMVVEPGLRPVKLVADILIWTSLTAGTLVLTQKIRSKRHT